MVTTKREFCILTDWLRHYVTLDFSTDPISPAAQRPRGRLSPQRKRAPWIVLGGQKATDAQGRRPNHHPCADRPENAGAPTPHKPAGPHVLTQREPYLLPSLVVSSRYQGYSGLIQSESESLYDWQSVSLSWCRAPVGLIRATGCCYIDSARATQKSRRLLAMKLVYRSTVAC
jgi:hypothetical protein